MSDPTLYPVVLVGENHLDGMHDMAERKIMKDLAELGYDTVALELPHNLQEPLETYLRSGRTQEDWRTLATAHVDARYPAPVPRPPPESLLGKVGQSLKGLLGGDEAYVHGRLRLAQIESTVEGPYRRHLRQKAEAADRLGLQVSLCDEPSSHPEITDIPNKKMAAYQLGRNKAMAQRIAETVRSGRRVMMFVGASHLNNAASPAASSLSAELEKLNVPITTFCLPLLNSSAVADHPGLSRKDKKEYEVAAKKVMEAADYSVKETEVAPIMAQRLQGIAFQRSGSAPVEIGGAGLSKEVRS